MKLYTKLLLSFFLISHAAGYGQKHVMSVETGVEQCTKGFAILNITGQGNKDSLAVSWSSGETDRPQISELSAGDYSVRIRFSYKDSVYHKVDTTLNFTIEKERCPLLVPKYFSPNDDGYNDLFTIGNIENYPDFELIIYNKVGQRVHHQQKNYQPWSGKWLGVDLPDATYYYVIFYDKKNTGEFIKGDVTILR